MSSSQSDPLAAFSRDELERYARHFSLAEVGPEGQRRIRDARVLVVGAGGLGSPATLYLAAAGVGTLGVIDADRVERSNLQRQIVHGTGDVGRPKAESAHERLHDLNPDVDLRIHRERLTSANAMERIRGYDLVVDGSDNFPTRYLVNDACVLQGKPWVYGAVLRWEGQLALFGAPDGPCYRCLFREPPPPGAVPGCAEAGVMGALPGVIGSLQALEAIKWILGVGDSAAGRLVRFDALALDLREVHPKRDPECPVCGDDPRITELIDYEWFCETGETRDAPAHAAHAAPDPGPNREPLSELLARTELDPDQLRRILDSDEPVRLIDIREGWEWATANLSREGARHLPMNELPERADEVRREASDARVVLYCQTGRRSGQAMAWLESQGVRAAHLAGGIEAWGQRFGLRERGPDGPADDDGDDRA